MNVADVPSPKSTFTVVNALRPLTVTNAVVPAAGGDGLTLIVRGSGGCTVTLALPWL